MHVLNATESPAVTQNISAGGSVVLFLLYKQPRCALMTQTLYVGACLWARGDPQQLIIASSIRPRAQIKYMYTYMFHLLHVMTENLSVTGTRIPECTVSMLKSHLYADCSFGIVILSYVHNNK